MTGKETKIKRRDALKGLAAATAIAAWPLAARAAEPEMVAVAKIIGIPWFTW